MNTIFSKRSFSFTMLLLLGFSQLSNGQSIDSLKGATIYKQGLELHSRKEYNKAIEVFTEAASLFGKENPLAFSKSIYKIGFAHDRWGKDDIAVNYYDSTLRILEKHTELDQNKRLEMRILLQKGAAHHYISEFDKSNQDLLKLRELCLIHPQDEQTDAKQLSYVDQYVGRNLMYMGELDSAYFYVQRSLESGKPLKDASIYGEAYNINAEYFWMVGHYQQSKTYLLKQYKLYQKKYGIDDPIIMRPTMHLGIISFEMGDYQDALRYFDKAYYYFHKQGDTLSIDYADLLINMSSCYVGIEETEKALELLNTATSIYERHPAQRSELFEQYAEQATLYAKIYDSLNAKEAISNAEKVFTEYPDDDYKNLMVRVRAAHTYQLLGNFEKSKILALKNLKKSKVMYNNKGPRVARDFYRISKNYYELADYAYAKVYLDSALLANDNSSNPLQIDLYTFRLELLAKYPTGYNEVVASIDEGNAFINSLRNSAKGEFGKVFLTKDFYTAALNLLYGIPNKEHDIELIFKMMQLSEKNKAMQLVDYLRQAENLNTLNVDKRLLATRNKTASKISIIEKQIEAAKKQADDKALSQLQTLLISFLEDYDATVAAIKEQYPQYYGMKYSIDELDIRQLQKLLAKESQNLISYHLGEDVLFILLITANNVVIERKEISDVLVSDVTLLRGKIANLEDISKLSAKFYNTLITPIENYIDTEKIIIVADEVLALMPFEILEDNSQVYLFEKYAISYEYSATVFTQNIKKQNKVFNEKLLAMAPEFSDNGIPSQSAFRNSLGALPGATKEVDEISALLNGNSFVGDQATETVFQNVAKDYGILHLATHAVVDDENANNSKLVFSNKQDTINDGYLYPYEIYNLDLNAKLVTLSACNTGYGIIRKGEGVISLSRAFAYAGCPSILMSLWPASDKSTPMIMSSFYSYLKDGDTKDVALRNAKKHYLETATGKARHPFYWGGFVLIGDNSPIVKTGGSGIGFII